MKKINALFLSIGIIVTCFSCKNSGQLPDNITDEIITQAVTRELKHYPEVPANRIKVTTSEGIVKLAGSVNNLLASEKAEEIATTIRGVEGVLNQLNIKTEEVSNETLKKNIEAMFYYDPIIEQYEIDVSVDSGHVVLTGMVDSWGEKQLAESISKFANGVKSVNNQIHIHYKDKRNDFEIKADIAGLMQYNVHVDYNFIDIKVKNGIVTLSGTVGSLFEKSKAENLAWVVGVDSVSADNLEIETQKRDVMQKNTFSIAKSDEEIQKAVEKILDYDARVSTAGIIVKVDEGNITLKGSVRNLRAKKAAEADANNILGGWGVINQLKVEPIIPTPKKEIQDKTEVALRIHPYLKSYTIQVVEDNGKVILKGNVKNIFEKQLAEDAISGVPGVSEIENNLEVIPVLDPVEYTQSRTYITEPDLPPDSTIQKEVEYELWWSPFVNENQVKVTVENGNVILNGTVNTRFEKQQAELNALEGGAFTVENNLVVEF
jgi:osmotically-inducible protein OsmY